MHYSVNVVYMTWYIETKSNGQRKDFTYNLYIYQNQKDQFAWIGQIPSNLSPVDVNLWRFVKNIILKKESSYLEVR